MARTEKVKAATEKTPEERLSGIRGSLRAKLYVTPEDQRWLVELYDAATSQRDALQAEIDEFGAKFKEIQAQHALGV